MVYTITGIDIGLHNLGLIRCIVKGTEITTLHFELVDLYKYRSNQSELHMLVKELVDEYTYMFDSDFIVIERQPPGGLVAIQELLGFMFKEKVTFISPRSVHSKLGLSYYDYDTRKCMAEKLFVKNLQDKELLDKYNNLTRKHDIADAYCLVKYFATYCLYCRREKVITKEPIEDPITFFDEFKFKRHCSI